jgi:superfamily II RNA helicase
MNAMSLPTGPPAYPLTDTALGPVTDDADALYAAFTDWVGTQGLELYPHQDEAIIELVSGRHVVLATPTGSGKSLVATAAHFAALAGDRVSFYTAPIKALVNEKFFALCEVFGSEQVGLLTGDASVNPDAPIIACTAEVLANIALREGAGADVGLVVMDEFHYYADPQRGWAWQVPLLELPQTQFLLMSATLGDMSAIRADLERRTGRASSEVTSAERPVPLSFAWSVTPLAEMIDEIVATRRAPVYVARRLAPVRFAAGFGRTLSALLRKGIGVHHAGMLPRYRRVVEQLAQAGLLKVICGTDTLGVGINVPIRTVLFTQLTKFDGSRDRLFKAREFHQIAGRAGRAGFDTSGEVIVQAPGHLIENARRIAKAGDDPVKLKRVQRVKPEPGQIVWTEQTFDKLVAAAPEPLVSRMRVDNAMLLNLVARPGDPVAALHRLLEENHETPAAQERLAQRACRLGTSLLDSGILVRLDPPGPDGRTIDLTLDLPPDFALNQPLAHFALAALELLDAEGETFALDIVSVVESVLDDPRPVLLAQQWAARGEAVAELKADGVEYDERMELLEEITWPKPLAELLEAAYDAYRESHPWLPEDALAPKSVLREMWEQAMSFTDLISRYGLSRSEGVVLRYLSDAYRTLRHTVPASFATPELEEILEWLGETIRQTDSSLLDEWAALGDPDHAPSAVVHHEAPPPPRPITANEKAFRTMVRRAMFHRVQLAARDDAAGLAALTALEAPGESGPAPDAAAWQDALAGYWALHDEIAVDADARGPHHFTVLDHPEGGRRWLVRQTLADPAGDHDWVLEAEVDIDGSDEAGELVLRTLALRHL